MFGSPEMMIASFAFQQIGAQRARSARRSQAAAQAAQYEQNAKFEQLRALQEHNARVDAFSVYEAQQMLFVGLTTARQMTGHSKPV